jgi:hypothetical protein
MKARKQKNTKKPKADNSAVDKAKIQLLPLLLLTVLFLSSCEAIGAIFKAGVWVGIVIVVIILIIIFWLIRKFSK